jgi:two-component system response regulator NreC
MIVDDHAILRVGLKMLIGSQPDMKVVGEAGDAEGAMTLAPKVCPDIILLDIAMPRVSGLQLVRRMRSMRPESRILILTMHSDLAFARSALSDGASGYVLKESADTDLLTALRAVARGGTFVDPRIAKELFAASQKPELLSEREKQVLKLLAQGFGNQEIAARLFVAVKTVETYRARISEKLHLRSRNEITRYALAAGLLTIEDALQNDDSVA